MAEKVSPTLDKRVARSRATVLMETYRQLSEGGIGGVSIDAVSKRSGVSKTTIYRHWPSRSALLLEACASFGAPARVPGTGSLRGDLHALLTSLAGALDGTPWSKAYPSILDAAERDPEIATVQKQLHAAFMAPFEAVLQRACAAGEASLQGRATSELVARLVGPLFFRRWFSREAIDGRFVDAIIDAALK
ncbi:TetR/AcrR family transcriptional regulator [Sphingomonas morindae]|uniref:TetR/AcrR family transcriptional regulator n=1 Tax=Sphingomonas morindae TaxID=1541170 RepID=A0ABY4XD23_9SPHN|nr:TetR/AcrR family transcriptional regulator [Sphingomonas morindae]USI74651.1 TetR/AcrR family transcriptional regulator [Sphingomonas morindae]